MFDSIKCEVKLPLPKDLRLSEVKDVDFNSLTYQTKDLNNSLELYTIRKDKTLWIHEQEYKWIPGNPKAKSVMDRIGHCEVIREWDEQLKDYTGTIEFYETIREDQMNYDYCIEFKATFVSGKLKKIDLVKFESESNAERKKNEANFIAELKAEKEFLSRWYIRFTYVPYRNMIQWIFHRWNRLTQILPSAHKVERFLLPW